MICSKWGWEFSYSQEHDRFGNKYSMYGRHRGMGLYMVSGSFIIDCVTSRDGFRMPRVEVKACAEQVSFSIMEPAEISFNPVDFTDRVMIPEVRTLEDMLPFSPMDSKNEIFVPEKEILSLSQHLKAITDMQKEKQKELREKKRRIESNMGSTSDWKSTPSIELKVISF